MGHDLKRANEGEKGSWRSAGLPHHLDFAWCRLTRGGRARGRRSTSINSSYITSLCWCQVAERKGRKESALTLFFSIVRPHLTLCIIPLRVCLHGYRRDPCLPNTTGGVPKILVPLLCFSHSSILPCYYRCLLSSSRRLDFICGVPPSFLLRWKGRNFSVWTCMQAFPIN